ncbi:hypothetical protein CEXT_478891 [Caerostris extrusa]|uniref:Uncharacterized protein n=1 Tax=Caerostris extrusa TaxID=172846 RepID=A0AAV4TW83_CAEEX|nr:hypothetical protein CEXT_478891 [Caerostris extrusa]
MFSKTSEKQTSCRQALHEARGSPVNQRRKLISQVPLRGNGFQFQLLITSQTWIGAFIISGETASRCLASIATIDSVIEGVALRQLIGTLYARPFVNLAKLPDK